MVEPKLTKHEHMKGRIKYVAWTSTRNKREPTGMHQAKRRVKRDTEFFFFKPPKVVFFALTCLPPAPATSSVRASRDASLAEAGDWGWSGWSFPNLTDLKIQIKCEERHILPSNLLRIFEACSRFEDL